MASFTVPFSRDVASYIADVERDFQNTVLLGGPHDPMSLALSAMIGMQRGLIEGDLIKLVADNIGNYADMPCDRLYQEGLKLGLPLRGAAPSRGYATLTGVFGTTIPSNLSITMTGGVFVLDTTQTVPTVIPASGEVAVPIVAQTSGVIGNQSAAGVGVLSTNIINIDSYVSNILTAGGYDAETCDEYRERLALVDALDNTPGSAGWHMRRAYRYPGVTRVCLDPCNCCEGQVTMYLFASGAFTDGIPDDAFIGKVQSEVFDTQIGATTYGSQLMGRTGVVKAATAIDIKVKISGTSGMLPESRKKAQDAIAAYFLTLCPGAAICKSTLLSLVSAQGACPSGVTFDYTPSTAFNDQLGYLFAECGILPILTEVCFV